MSSSDLSFILRDASDPCAPSFAILVDSAFSCCGGSQEACFRNAQAEDYIRLTYWAIFVLLFVAIAFRKKLFYI